MKSWGRTNLIAYAGAAACCCALMLCAGPAQAADTAVAANVPVGLDLDVPVKAAPSVLLGTNADAQPADAQSKVQINSNSQAQVPEKTSAVKALAAASATSATAMPAERNIENDLIGGRGSSSATGAAAAHSTDAARKASSSGLSFFDILGPLIGVLAAIVILFWAARKYLPAVRRMGGSPSIKLVARTHLSPRQSISLVKVGRRVLVVGQSGDQLSSLGSIDNAEEVSELLGQFESSSGNSSTAAFRKIFRSADREFEGLEEEQGTEEANQEVAPVGAAVAQAESEDAEMSRVRSELESLTRKVREVAATSR